MAKKYIVELTEPQMRMAVEALEEYFRLRMGQDFDFSTDMAGINTDLSPEHPEHERIFDRYIVRRDCLRAIMGAYYRVAFEPRHFLEKKTEGMLIAECMWEAFRHALGMSRWDKPMQIGGEPLPKIEAKEDA